MILFVSKVMDFIFTHLIAMILGLLFEIVSLRQASQNQTHAEGKLLNIILITSVCEVPDSTIY